MITEAGGRYDYTPKEVFHTSSDARYRWQVVNSTKSDIVVQLRNFQRYDDLGGKIPKCPGQVEQGEEPKPCEPRLRQIDPNTSGRIAIWANASSPGDAFKFDLAVGKTDTDVDKLQVFDPELEIDRGTFISLYPVLALLPLAAIAIWWMLRRWQMLATRP